MLFPPFSLIGSRRFPSAAHRSTAPDAISGTVNIILKERLRRSGRGCTGRRVRSPGRLELSLPCARRPEFCRWARQCHGGGREFFKADGLSGHGAQNFSQDHGLRRRASLPGPADGADAERRVASDISTSGIRCWTTASTVRPSGLNPNQIGVTSGAGQVLAWSPAQFPVTLQSWPADRQSDLLGRAVTAIRLRNSATSSRRRNASISTGWRASRSRSTSGSSRSVALGGTRHEPGLATGLQHRTLPEVPAR